MPGPNAKETTLDTAAAVDEIGAGLGFATEDEGGGDDLGLGGAGDEGEGTSLADSALAKPDDVTDVVAKDRPAAPAEGEASPETPAPAEADVPPKTWRKEASALWAGLPSEAKAEILKREADIFKGIEGYKAEATFGRSMKQVFAPYEQIMRQANIDPFQHVAGLMQAHHILATGNPQTKLAFFQKLAKDYQVELAPAESAGDAPYVDPAVLDLRQQLQMVQSQLSETAQRRQQELVETNRRQVDAFASDPKNAYFNEVADDMVALLNSKLAPTLEAAYEQAVWRNPTTRAKEIARKAAEQAKASAVVVTAKTAQVRAATAANVKASAKSGSATTPLGSLDDTLSETLASIRSRA